MNRLELIDEINNTFQIKPTKKNKQTLLEIVDRFYKSQFSGIMESWEVEQGMWKKRNQELINENKELKNNERNNKL